jgi:hypothetical protein
MLGWRLGFIVPYVHIVVSQLHAGSAPCSLWPFLRPLLHLQPQQACLGTADTFCTISILSIEGIAAFIESIDLGPALRFIIGVLCEAVCEPLLASRI